MRLVVSGLGSSCGYGPTYDVYTGGTSSRLVQTLPRSGPDSTRNLPRLQLCRGKEGMGRGWFREGDGTGIGMVVDTGIGKGFHLIFLPLLGFKFRLVTENSKI